MVAGPDFVAVKLSSKGEEVAQGAPVTIIDGVHMFVFKPGEVREDITRAFDWERVLKNQARDGESLFEVVEVAAQ